MKACKIADNVYWVGAIDWDLRSFHGYSTDKGTTYNAYLILDEKITLIDNVKAAFTDEMLRRIATITDPGKIDIIISNHGEPDHSGSLPRLLSLAPDARIYSSAPNGPKILNAIYGDLSINPVRSYDELSIGRRTLQFIQTPMVHWPDNMVTYCKEQKILFSNDIFGQHYATAKLFDNANDIAVLLHEAKKYYANIVLPHTKSAKKAADELAALDIDIIATSHGVIWKHNVPDIMALYDNLVNARKTEKAVVAYDSMWGNTATIAKAITEAFMEKGIPVRMYDIGKTDDSDIIADIVDAKYLAVGSSTLNNTMLPSVAGFLNYLKGLAPTGMRYVAFGSYGWGGQSVGQIAEILDVMKLSPLIAPVRLHYNPKPGDLRDVKTAIIESLNN